MKNSQSHHFHPSPCVCVTRTYAVNPYLRLVPRVSFESAKACSGFSQQKMWPMSSGFSFLLGMCSFSAAGNALYFLCMYFPALQVSVLVPWPRGEQLHCGIFRQWLKQGFQRKNIYVWKKWHIKIYSWCSQGRQASCTVPFIPSPKAVTIAAASSC